MSGGKMNSYGSSPIRFRKDDIADVDARTEYFLLVPIFWEQPRPLAYVQEALDKLWKCQGFVTLDLLAPRLAGRKLLWMDAENSGSTSNMRRKSEVEVQPLSKRKLTYEEKGKGKMQWKDKKLHKANPRQNGGIIIREPSEHPSPVDNQKVMAQHHFERQSSSLIMGEEDEANSDQILGDILGLNVPGGGVKEL
ncbi:hypothetical protein LINPERHAP1_LOCUS19118 [Linum perenne]